MHDRKCIKSAKDAWFSGHAAVAMPIIHILGQIAKIHLDAVYIDLHTVLKNKAAHR